MAKTMYEQSSYAEIVEELRIVEQIYRGNGAEPIADIIKKATDAMRELQKQYLELAHKYVQLAAHTEWIPVEKQLPQMEKDVLVCAYGTLIRTWCLHQKYSKRFWETEEGYFDDFNAVSHWMPLPDLPKDGEI